jgi:hypothetical protein
MAVRLNRKTAEAVRQRIQTTQLVKRVQSHALGEVEMTSTQLDAAKFLINKRMPNPPEDKNINHSGEVATRLIIDG